MIYIIEGADGTGKTTLAEAIQRETKGHLLHLTFNKDWTMEQYYSAVFRAVWDLAEYQDVVIDRWIPSEIVYGHVFRDGPSFDTSNLLNIFGDRAKWVYCWNENAVENHLKNKEVRPEMFDDMKHVVEAFGTYVEGSGLPWKLYNYNHMETNNFVKELVND